FFFVCGLCAIAICSGACVGYCKIKPFKKFSQLRVYLVWVFHKILVKAFNKCGRGISDIGEIFHFISGSFGLQISLKNDDFKDAITFWRRASCPGPGVSSSVFIWPIGVQALPLPSSEETLWTKFSKDMANHSATKKDVR